MDAPHRLLFALTLALVAPQARAETLIATADGVAGTCPTRCSLREAVAYASAQPGAHRIELAPGTYHLGHALQRDASDPAGEDASAAGDLDVTSELTIVGAGIGQTVIDGDHLDRIFDVHLGARLNLERLTLRNGKARTEGGALRNRSETRLDQVMLEDNQVMADTVATGGAIANLGSLLLTNSTLRNNRALSNVADAGRGGAIYNRGHLFIRTSTLESNLSSGQGGALYNLGSVDVARSAFIGNALSGRGSGAAILNTEGGVLLMSNSTLSQNRPGDGQGAFANGQPGASGNASTLAFLANVSIVDNGNYGLVNFASMTLRNSLIAGNRHPAGQGEAHPRNCLNQGARFRARGLLLGEDGGACRADWRIDDALTFTQLLGPLADNGGPTRTHALLAGSPALDRGTGSCTRHDQRSAARRQDGDGNGVPGCDLGAFERRTPRQGS
ncbi:choice-of-anchor Q domain-containing protein [Pseudomonas mangiferae]|uniref:CSLREA domain-containing protein n=1 Tax=Pseudomonas mangiferae TaxID=2593654 RepID=A0A553H3X5_9PSED|nr:choice-of-anchor Q domain-containing protein [Pseudomonas mangiferae]TRX76455.1 hypothetical protein FM069_00055 [Pseudomonas mangiferae]